MREVVIGLLYAYECGNTNIAQNAPKILDERKIKNKQQIFALALLNGTLKNLEAINMYLGETLKEWEFTRLGQMEKSILRLGAYEMLFTQTDTPVIINEAINFAKIYGEDNAPKLINGVLDALKHKRGMQPHATPIIDKANEQDGL